MVVLVTGAAKGIGRETARVLAERGGTVIVSARDGARAQQVADELVRATGFGKATVYRLFPTKDALVGAYLERHAQAILELIDRDIAEREPADAVRAIFGAIEADLARPGFRGCAFNNASIEFDDPEHPARAAAREYRAALHARLRSLAERIRPADGERLGGQLAVVLDGMYTSAAHLGPDGPASTAGALVETLLEP